MQRVDAYASEPHYFDHLKPLWDALPAEAKGTFYASQQVYAEGLTFGPPRGRGAPVIVASFKDSRQAAREGRPRIYLEHGAGQVYIDAAENGGYSGGDGHGGTILFLCPNETVAARWRERYPGVPAAVIGCPRLDIVGAIASQSLKLKHASDQGKHAYSKGTSGGTSEGDKRGNNIPRKVAISFHWHCGISPEADWAFPHFESALPVLRDRFDLIGHGHPRSWRFLEHTYKRLGIEPVRSFDEVMERASVYVTDNSSTLYEAAVRMPVVAMNAPWYRRDVHHGLRFWESIPGLQCDDPEDLPETIERALEDPPEVRRIRHSVVRSVYSHLGTAASRGAAAILEVMDH